MKRKLYFLTLLMCILSGFNLSNLNAQTTVTIDGADNATYSIADNWQGYGASQQIYTATEIGSAGTITKIAFHKADNTNDGNRTWSIYLKEIDATSFTNNSTYPMTSNDLVYSGTFNASSGWVTLDINDFAYNGGNLLVTVLDNSGSKSPGDQSWSYNTSIVSKCLVKSQGASIDITSSNQFNVFGGRFSIQLTFEGGTPQPQEQIIEIGSSTTESYYLPTNRAYNYSLTQQIYTNAEIGETNIDIKSIAFKDKSGVESTRNIEVYMRNTTDEGCSTTSKQMNASELCFSGNVTFAANDWTTITFTTPFEYSDVNFLLCVVDKTGNYGDWSNFATYATANNNKSFCIYSDDTQYSASSEHSFNTINLKNYIKIGYTESVAVDPSTPTNLTANAISYNTVDLEWTAAENAKKYNVYQGNDKIAENVSGTYFQVTGLDAETNYCFTVTAVNSVGESEHSESACAKTLEEPSTCNIVFTLKDNYNGSGDGWNGGNLNVSYNGQNTVYTLSGGGYVQYSLEIPQGTNVKLNYIGSSWPEENALIVAYEDGREIVNEDFGEMTQTMEWNFTVDCTVPVPDAPDLTAMALSKSAVRLRWNDVDFATSYNIYNRAGDLLETGLTETSFLFEDLDPETMYCYTVTAVGDEGESEHSVEACAMTFEESGGCVVTFALKDINENSNDGWNGNRLVVQYASTSREFTLLNTNAETFTLEIPQNTDVTVTFIPNTSGAGNGYSQENSFVIAYESGKEILAVDGWTDENYSQYNPTPVTYNLTIDCSNSTMIQIGEGTIGAQNIPVDMFYKYSYSQQSYTRDEIVEAGGFEGYITTIAYHVNYIVGSPKRSLKIFMSNTDNETTFTSTSASYPLSNNTDGLVFDGEVEFASTGWVEIPLMAPFSYNGNHIVITVIDNTGTDAAAYFTTHTKGGYDITWTSNNANNDNPIVPTTLSGNINTLRNNIKLRFVPTDAMLEFVGAGSWDITTNWNLRKVPTANDDASIIGDAVITGAAMAKSITIDEGSITLESGSLTVTDNFTNTDASAFIIEDGAQVFQTSEGVMATFKMNVENPTDAAEYNPTGWQFISSPMKDAAIAGFETEDGYDLFKYVGDIDTDLEWVNYKGQGDFEAKFQQGRGYMASYHAENGVAEFVGELNNETTFSFDSELEYTVDDHFANFFLLGNPFTFNMKWNDNNIAASGLAEGYAVVTTEGGYTYATTGEIKVGDGFFVKAEGTPSLTYTANTRGRNKDNNYINLIASGKAGQDNVIINFADNGRDGFNKLENFNKNIAEIYVTENESRYGILNYSEDVEEINIYFNAKQMGYYTINALTNADFANVTLVDRLTGVETDILTDSYTFQAMTDDAPDRFILRMNRQVESENFVYRSGEELIINAEGSVQIIDVMGRIVYSNEIVNDNHRVNIGSLNDAAYIVRVVNANEVKTQKVVIW